MQSNFQGIPGNPLKATASPDLWGVISKTCFNAYFEPIFGHIDTKEVYWTIHKLLLSIK